MKWSVYNVLIQSSQVRSSTNDIKLLKLSLTSSYVRETLSSFPWVSSKIKRKIQPCEAVLESFDDFPLVFPERLVQFHATQNGIFVANTCSCLKSEINKKISIQRRESNTQAYRMYWQVIVEIILIIYWYWIIRNHTSLSAKTLWPNGWEMCWTE